MRLTFYKRLWKYAGKDRWLFIISLLFSAIDVAASLTLPILFGKAADLIIGEGNVDFGGIARLSVIALCCICAAALSQWVTEFLSNRIANAIVRRVRNDAFENLERVPIKYIDGRPTGDILGVEIGDADRLADGLLLGFSRFFGGILTIIGTLVCMIIINPLIAAAVAVLTPVSLFTAKFITGRTYGLFKKQAAVTGEEASLIEETLGNLATVKAYTAEKSFSDKFDNINKRLKDTSFKAVFFSSLTNPTTRFINALIYAVVALIGAVIAVSGGGAFAITAGSLLALLSYSNKYTKPFNEISSVLTELSGAKACGERLFSVIDEKREEISGDKDEKIVLSGDVDIKDVCFSYSPDKKLIENFRLSAKRGEKIAIVGPTGCGKTTLVNLIMRFYDVNSGKIEVDGKDIRELNRQNYRRNIGMVLQDTWIRTASVKDNVKIGKPSASDEEIVAACKAAHAHGFISRLENGYDTVIGEEGLSQGQKQLICIARVMLSLPPMLILDEATSSIDTRTELKIQEAFDRLTRGKTSFVVAHRLSTIRSADIILVMKDGNVIEQGNHDELLSKKGFYFELYNSQFEK